MLQTQVGWSGRGVEGARDVEGRIYAEREAEEAGGGAAREAEGGEREVREADPADGRASVRERASFETIYL